MTFRINNKPKNQEKEDPIVQELKDDLELLKRDKMKLEIQLAELNHLKFIQLMVPFSHLGTCKTFGELALQ